jgi:hypothetical protein
VSNKGIADMFGLTLRTYHNKVSRLSESSTVRGRSLWEALFGFIEEQGTVSRARVLGRFSADEDMLVRGVLRELVDAGLVFRAGQGEATLYRAAGPEERAEGAETDTVERLAHLLWVAIKRFGPLGQAQLADIVPAGQPETNAALTRLLDSGRVDRRDERGVAVYSSSEFVIPATDPAGWEAAVFDHYQALVTTIATKLSLRRSKRIPLEWVGGTTYSYEVWRDHPHFEEVVDFLESSRRRALSLRQRVEKFNATHGLPATGLLRVVVYAGQTILGIEDEEERF